MTSPFRAHFNAHAEVVRDSLASLEEPAMTAGIALVECLRAGGKVMTFGNGGSSAEAGHFAEELVGRYKKSRGPLPAMSLSADSGTLTCISNDYGYESLFDRQIEAFAREGDIAVALTTSGKSENVIRGLRTARKCGAVTIALTGRAGLTGVSADHVLAVPSEDSALIQEVHLMLIHFWCDTIEREL